jgi:hypothetical protein
MRKPSRAIVLAEDEEHNMFVRRYLMELGLVEREIYTEPLPAGRGCGEQWVRNEYARVVGAYRRRAAKARTALVVVIDADGGDVSRRLRQMEEGLIHAAMGRRTLDERIAHFVPRRNIETWILCLNGEVVDEEADYKGRRGVEKRISPAAAALYEWTRNNAIIPNRCVASLAAAIPEARRVEQ